MFKKKVLPLAIVALLLTVMMSACVATPTVDELIQ